MTAADRLGRARQLLKDAEAELQAAAYAAPEQRRRLKGELANLRCSRERLGMLSRKLLAAGWGRFARAGDKRRDDDE